MVRIGVISNLLLNAMGQIRCLAISEFETKRRSNNQPVVLLHSLPCQPRADDSTAIDFIRSS